MNAKEQLLEIIKMNKSIALDFYWQNQSELKGVNYDSGIFGSTLVKLLTIDNKEYIIEKEELNILELC